MTITETASEHRARVLGSFDTAVRRSRKGRSTFVVTARRRRWQDGADALTATLDDTREPDYVKRDSLTLVAQADAWVAANDPTEHVCTCDDLTEQVPVWTGATVWHVPAPGCEGPSSVAYRREQKRDDTGALVYRTRHVRRCHCAPFPALLGSDLGRSWQELTPGVMTSGRRPSRMRLRSPRQRKGEDWQRVEHADGSTTTFGRHGVIAPGVDAGTYWDGHVLVKRTKRTAADRKADTRAARYASAPRPEWQDTADAIAAHVGEAATFVVQGVTVTLTTPGATGRFRARLTYLDGTTRDLQARTAAPIARAVMA